MVGAVLGTVDRTELLGCVDEVPGSVVVGVVASTVVGTGGAGTGSGVLVSALILFVSSFHRASSSSRWAVSPTSVTRLTGPVEGTPWLAARRRRR